MVPDDFDGILSEEERKEFQQIRDRNEISSEDATPSSVGDSYKNDTGRDLDQNVYGYDAPTETPPSNEITGDVGQQAQEAAATIKDDVTAESPEPPQQRDNAFTQLGDTAEPDQNPAPEKDNDIER